MGAELAGSMSPYAWYLGMWNRLVHAYLFAGIPAHPHLSQASRTPSVKGDFLEDIVLCLGKPLALGVGCPAWEATAEGCVPMW